MSISNWSNKFKAQNTATAGTVQAIGQLFGTDVLGELGLQNKLRNSELASNPNGGFNVQNFMSQINETGFVRPTLFLAIITLPRIITGYDQKQLTLLTHSVSLPGVSFITSDNIRRYGMGQIESRPYAVSQTDIDFTFYVDGYATINKFFYEWMNNIVPSNVDSNLTVPRGSDGSRFYLSNYKEDYVTTIEFLVFNEFSNKVMSAKLREAYPLALNPLTMDWDARDQVAQLNVSFKFTDWTNTFYDVEPNQGEDNDSGLSFLQKLQKGNSVIQTLSTITKPNSINDIANVVNNVSIAKSGLTDLF